MEFCKLPFNRRHGGFKNDIPDYKPHSLKLPFLTLLFLFVCAIIGLLEHMIRTLPPEHNRTKIPQDYDVMPLPRRGHDKRHDITVNTAPEKRQREDLVSPSRTLPPHASHTSIVVQRTAAIQAIKVASPDPEPRPPSSQYVNKEPITTYLTWADSWYDEIGTNREVESRTPLFPGDDPRGKCIFRYQGLVMTTNSSGCRALIGLGDRQPPSGWKRGTWLGDDIWFPRGGGCDENYDDWYSGWPSNQSSAIPEPTHPLPYPSYFESLLYPMGRCSWYNGVTPTTTYSWTGTGKPPGSPWLTAVRYFYVAVDFPRRPDGSIIWPVVGNETSGNSTYEPAKSLTMLQAIRPDKGIYKTLGVYLEPSSENMVPSVSAVTTESATQQTSQPAQESSRDTYQEPHQETSYQETSTRSTLRLSESFQETTDKTTQVTTTRIIQIITGESTNETYRPSQSATHSDLATDEPTFRSTSSKATIDSVPPATVTHTSISEAQSVEENSPAVTTKSTHSVITAAAEVSSSISISQPQPHVEFPTSRYPDRYFYIPDTRFGPPGATTTFSFELWSSTEIRPTTFTQEFLLAVPVILATAQISTVLTDAQGEPTATITDYGGDLVEGSTIISTLTNPKDGLPTSTLTIQIPTGASVVLTKNDPDGKPTATVTLFPIVPNIPNARPARIVVPTEATYFLVYFLPILLTALLLLPMQAIDAEIKLFMPFRLLTRPDGSPDALPMRTSGFIGRWNGLRLLLFRYKDPISLLSDLMILCTAALVSLSGETIGLKLRGTCVQHNLNTCFTTVAVFPEMARAAQGLLSALSVLILVLAILLNRWKTGVPAHPTSIAAVCAMLQVPGTRGLIQEAQLRVTNGPGEKAGRLDSKIAERYKAIRFRFGRATGDRVSGYRTAEYGLIGTEDGDTSSQAVAARTGARTLIDDGRPELPEKMKLHVPVGERVEQGVYLFFLCGLLTIILYYELTVFEDPSATPFEWFMDSQTFGPRVLFTSFGVLVSFMWDHLFSSFSKRATYRQMAQRNQPAALSILQTRPTNVFIGLCRAIRQRDSLMSSIAAAGILSKFLPAFLSSIPFAAAQTWITHEICTWGAVAILITMIIVLLSHALLVKWPYMPAAAPDSLACCVYYVCDSAMLRDFEGLSMLQRRERDRRIERMARRYRFGWMTGVSGERRIGVDYPPGEQGFMLRSLGAMGFGVAGRKR